MMNKDILAKLLAQENITVVQEKVETASFNVKDRVLTLPMWEEMENFTYNHLVGHEVGHALYTNQDDWESALEGKTKGYKSFLNVVEDARIEKLIQRRYPGLRRDFVLSYKKLFADGFFGTNKDEINALPLIDRLNTYFKCGTAFGVQFDEEEKQIAKEIEGVETFAEVKEIVDRLYADAVEKMKEQQEQQAQMNAEMDAEDEEFDEEMEGFSSGDNFFDPLDDEMEESEDGSSSDDESSEESSESSEGSVSANQEGEGEESETDKIEVPTVGADGAGKSGGEPTEPTSLTEDALNKAIEQEFAGTGDVTNVFFSEESIDQFIVKPKDILALLDDRDYEYGAKHFKKFQANNKKVINYLVKEFEMKKKASEYARTTVSKTGVIDPVLMNSYRYSDDIFKKMAVTPEGKNHGLMMFVDWSGSMHQDMGNTLDQLLNLVMFCRQVQIPFRVYAFTDRGYDWKYAGHEVTPTKVVGETTLDKDFRLMEFFNSKTMKRAEMTKMLHLISWLKSRMYYGYGFIPNPLNLGGTPLDATIIASAKMFEEFKKKDRLDIVNMVFLTDGESHETSFTNRSYRDGGEPFDMYLGHAIGRDSTLILRDKVTKKSYRLSLTDGRRGSRYLMVTNTLLRRLRDRTGANVIGYRIVPLNKRHFYNQLSGYTKNYYEMDQMHTELKKERFITIPNSGYSEFFALAGGKQLKTSNGAIEVAEDASKGQIRTAFKKANKGKKESRVMLSKFIDMVA